MSSDPSSGDPDTGAASMSEKGGSVIEPTSAPYAVDYLIQLDIEANNGLDSLLRNDTLRAEYEYADLHLHRDFGHNMFDQSKEDLWLFHIHLHNSSNHRPIRYSEMEIAIGGNTTVFVDSKPTWQTITSEEGRWVVVKKSKSMSHALVHLPENGTYDQYVAVRCPKMDNPAITVKANGHYGALHGVGLFLKTTAANTHRFIAVKTNARLLPHYAERMKNYPSAPEWFTEDSGVDVLDRTLTLFPKQLYGTKGDSASLYDKYVNQDPTNPLGQCHFRHVAQSVTNGGASPASKYVWHATGVTYLKSIYLKIDPYRDATESELKFDHVSMVEAREKKMSGWTVFLNVFGNVVQIAVGVFTGSLASVVGGVYGIVEGLDEENMKKEADLKGCVTAVATAIDDYRKEKRRRDKERKEEEGKMVTTIHAPNAADIPSMTEHLQNGTLSMDDFGKSTTVIQYTLPPWEPGYRVSENP